MLFGVPIVVPAQGEFVALGAARQAAALVNGSVSSWVVPIAAEYAAHPVDAIMAAFVLAAQKVEG